MGLKEHIRENSKGSAKAFSEIETLNKINRIPDVEKSDLVLQLEEAIRATIKK